MHASRRSDTLLFTSTSQFYQEFDEKVSSKITFDPHNLQAPHYYPGIHMKHGSLRREKKNISNFRY